MEEPDEDQGLLETRQDDSSPKQTANTLRSTDATGFEREHGVHVETQISTAGRSKRNCFNACSQHSAETVLEHDRREEVSSGGTAKEVFEFSFR